MCDVQRPRAADGIVDEFECDGVSDDEVVDRRPFGDVASMEERFAAIRRSHEAVALAHEEFGDAPLRRDAALFVGRTWFSRGHRLASNSS
jgi:hypothetical protein